MSHYASDFTQLVWKSSLKLGVGCAQANIDGWNVGVVVGRYEPPGNMMRQYQQNSTLLKKRGCKIISCKLFKKNILKTLKLFQRRNEETITPFFINLLSPSTKC